MANRVFLLLSLSGDIPVSVLRTPYIYVWEYTRAWPGLVGCLLRLSRLIPVCTSAIVEIVLCRRW